MVIVGDFLESGGELIRWAVVGDLVDKILEVDIDAFVEFSFWIGENPDHWCFLIIHDKCIGD